jgi:hypothetical protein
MSEKRKLAALARAIKKSLRDLQKDVDMLISLAYAKDMTRQESGHRGGKRRLETMTSEERKQAAKRAAEARWKNAKGDEKGTER